MSSTTASGSEDPVEGADPPPHMAPRVHIAPPEQPRKPFFGIKQDPLHHGYVFNDDYDKRFPEDEYCKETAPNARVWRTYVEEAAAFDANMIGQSRDSLDVMLVFAGLFSAVVTSFLVQVSQSLQADYGQMTAVLLHDIVFIQLALADGASVANITRPSIDPTAPFVAAGMNVWVNGLWVVSLTASLAVALAAVLVKQWLHHYASLHSGTPRDRSQIRHFRFTGFERWHVRVIIGMLPIVMHLSLALFLSGLILFFIPLSAPLAWAVGVITVVLCTLYLVSNLLPILFPQCPYQTPLSDFLNYAYQAMLLLWHSIQRAVKTRPSVDRGKTENHFQSLMTLEKASAQEVRDTVTVDALDWLFGVSSNPVVEEIVVMAIGGLPTSAQQYAISTWHHTQSTYDAGFRVMKKIFGADSGTLIFCSASPFLGLEPAIERMFRSFLFLPIPCPSPVFDLQTTGHARFDLVRAISLMTLDPPNVFEMRDLIIAHHDTPVHPLIWKELVASAAAAGAFRLCNPKLSAGMHARFIAAMLPIGLPFPFEEPEPLVLQACPHPALWDYLSEMPSLSPFDVHPFLPKDRRVLLAAAKFAVHHIGKGTTEETPLKVNDPSSSSELQWHWVLLETVLDRFAFHFPLARPTDGFVQVLERAITLSGSLDPDNEDLPLSASLQYQDKCTYLILRIINNMEGLQIPSLLSQVMHVSLSRLTYSLDPGCNQHCLDYALFPSILNLTCALMPYSLQLDNCHEAYRLFVDDKWMANLGPLWVIQWPRDWLWPRWVTLSAYIAGLASPSMSSCRPEYIDHLYEPENLAIAMCVLSEDPDSLQSLVELNPTHPSWERCRGIMETIVAWNARPSWDTTEFPVDLVRGMTVHCRDQSIPLQEPIRTRFMGEKTRVILEKAMQILNASLPKPIDSA